jgi:hypothetical protein
VRQHPALCSGCDAALQRKNAVDGPTVSRARDLRCVLRTAAAQAKLLSDAFRAFESDCTRASAAGLSSALTALAAECSVAVLWGEGGTFCAGADLQELKLQTRANALVAVGKGDSPMV